MWRRLHGLEPKPEGGAITISADIVDGRLRVTVADTGLGFAAGSQPGTGVGLANVRERLAALYGGRARLSIDANQPIADKSAYTAIVVKQFTANSGPTITLNTNYDATEIPVPDGIRGAGQPVALAK